MPLPTLPPNSGPIIFTSPLHQFPIYKIHPHFAKLGPLSATNRTRTLMPPSSLICPTSAFACGLGSFCAILRAQAMNGDGGSSKKLRKPYTITKSRDRWSEEEHERFLDGLLLFGREWKKIEDFVGTKTVIQIRSHAQKYFIKVQKNGLMSHVPPLRPVRKHVYPQKSSDNDMLPLQAPNCFVSSCSSWDDKSMLIDYNNESMPPDHSGVFSGVEGDTGSGMANMYTQEFGWSESSGKSTSKYNVPEQETQQPLYPVTPNFAEVYSLIATFVDPENADPFGLVIKSLKEMDPVTAKTALVMVKNLASNLSSPDFEPLRRWLLNCEAKIKTDEEMNDVATTANQMYIMPTQ